MLVYNTNTSVCRSRSDDHRNYCTHRGSRNRGQPTGRSPTGAVITRGAVLQMLVFIIFEGTLLPKNAWRDHNNRAGMLVRRNYCICWATSVANKRCVRVRTSSATLYRPWIIGPCELNKSQLLPRDLKSYDQCVARGWS